MDKLWAPWRIKYVSARKQKKCIFCRALRSSSGDYVIFKSRYSFDILNIFPYNNGHVMISPKKHLADTAFLSNAELLDLLKTTNKVKSALKKALHPSAFNIGINLGRDAGAGVTGHLHIHIVPRWRGDTNFMPTLSATKVISQSLKELHKILKKSCSTKN